MRAMRWPILHAAGLRWVSKVERAVERLDHPEQGAFVSLTNALEFHFEAGADPTTVRHLVHALLAFTRAVGLDPKALGVPEDPDAFVASLAPRSKGSDPR